MYTEVIPTVGVNVYPLPPVVSPIGPNTASDITAVAIATDIGLPPVNVTIGGSVYPKPGFVISILSIDWLGTPVLLVMIATAVAWDPRAGWSIVIIGTEVYPHPS